MTRHHDHFSVEAGLPQQRVLLWLAGDRLRAEDERVVLAEDRGRSDWQERQVTDIREGVLSQTRFTSSQGTLIPVTPQDRGVVSRPTPPRCRGPQGSPVQQVLLFAGVPTG